MSGFDELKSNSERTAFTQVWSLIHETYKWLHLCFAVLSTKPNCKTRAAFVAMIFGGDTSFSHASRSASACVTSKIFYLDWILQALCPCSQRVRHNYLTWPLWARSRKLKQNSVCRHNTCKVNRQRIECPEKHWKQMTLHTINDCKYIFSLQGRWSITTPCFSFLS